MRKEEKARKSIHRDAKTNGKTPHMPRRRLILSRVAKRKEKGEREATFLVL